MRVSASALADPFALMITNSSSNPILVKASGPILNQLAALQPNTDQTYTSNYTMPAVDHSISETVTIEGEGGDPLCTATLTLSNYGKDISTTLTSPDKACDTEDSDTTFAHLGYEP